MLRLDARALDQGRPRARRRPVAERRRHQRRLGLVPAARAAARRRRLLVDPRGPRPRQRPDPLRRPARPARAVPGRPAAVRPDVRRAEGPGLHRPLPKRQLNGQAVQVLFRPADLRGSRTGASRSSSGAGSARGCCRGRSCGRRSASWRSTRSRWSSAPDRRRRAGRGLRGRRARHRLLRQAQGRAVPDRAAPGRAGPADRAARDAARRRGVRAPGADGRLDLRGAAPRSPPTLACARLTSPSPSGARPRRSSATCASSRNWA